MLTKRLAAAYRPHFPPDLPAYSTGSARAPLSKALPHRQGSCFIRRLFSSCNYFSVAFAAKIIYKIKRQFQYCPDSNSGIVTRKKKFSPLSARFFFIANQTRSPEMKLLIPAQRTPLLIAQLVKVWEASVKATHLFLSAGEIEKIKGYVPDALKNVSHLLIAENGKSEPVAFMGIEGRKIEMLFIAPEERGKGLGRQLIKYGIENYAVNEVCVNEQNPQAVGFYEHMGFRVYKRTDFDEQGNPYPILCMELG